MASLVRAVVSANEVERLCVVATLAGCTGVAEIPREGRVAMLVGFETDADARYFVASIAPVEATIEQPDQATWAIHHPVVVERGGRRIELEVGTSFGHGGHPTTTLALDAIDALGPGEDRTLVDVGCGTGVLAIWAARAGFEATGCDIDPEAVARSRANAIGNRVDDRTRFLVANPLDLARDVAARFDVAVANILIGVHEEQGRAIAALLAPAAPLIVTGILVEHEDRLIEAYPGRRPGGRHERDGWLQLTLESG